MDDGPAGGKHSSLIKITIMINNNVIQEAGTTSIHCAA